MVVDTEKLAKLSQAVRIGGKGTPRRKVKRTSGNRGSSNEDDKKLVTALQKLKVQPLPGIDQVTMLRDDGKVLQFKPVTVQAAVPSNTFAVYGRPQEKDMQEFLPEVLSSMDSRSLEQLRQLSERMGAGGAGAGAGAGAAEAEDDDIPDLVEGETFENQVD